MPTCLQMQAVPISFVADQDLDVDLQIVEPLQRLRRGVLGRVEEGQEPEENEVGLVLHGIDGTVRRGQTGSTVPAGSRRECPAPDRCARG